MGVKLVLEGERAAIEVIASRADLCFSKTAQMMLDGVEPPYKDLIRAVDQAKIAMQKSTERNVYSLMQFVSAVRRVELARFNL